MASRETSRRRHIPEIIRFLGIHIYWNEIYNENVNLEGSEFLNFTYDIVARDDDHDMI